MIERYRTREDFANTILILTGSHRRRLPHESLMDRYCEPFMVYSPLVKGPVPSLDLTPTLRHRPFPPWPRPGDHRFFHTMTDAPSLPEFHPLLFDERSRPDLREVYGGLLRRSRHLDVALTRIRLSTLDLGREDLERLFSLRLLLAEVSAVNLELEAHGVMLRPEKRETLATLAGLLKQGIIEVRSAPLGGWSPDFSVFRGATGPTAVLLGLHWFERPFPHRGPALASLHGPSGAALALGRFEGAWRRAHDIGPAITGILERAERGVRERRPGERRDDTPGGTNPGTPEGTDPGTSDTAEGVVPQRLSPPLRARTSS